MRMTLKNGRRIVERFKCIHILRLVCIGAKSTSMMSYGIGGTHHWHIEQLSMSMSRLLGHTRKLQPRSSTRITRKRRMSWDGCGRGGHERT